MISPPSKPRTLPAITPGILAAVLFIPLFAIRRIGPLDFRWWMSLNAVAVMAYSFIADRSYLKLIKDDLKTGPGEEIFWRGFLQLQLSLVIFLLESIHIPDQRNMYQNS